THRAYNCRIDGRLVTSADQYGTLVTRIDLRLDRTTHDVVDAKAENLIVRTDGSAKDREQTELIAAYEQRVQAVARRVVGSVTATLSRAPAATGESVLGGVIADAQLAATRAEPDGGAALAFTNPGGIRTDILKREDGMGHLRGPVRLPAVRQPACHPHALGGADQAVARAAVAPAAAAAHPAGLEELFLPVGCRTAGRRAGRGRCHHAQRAADRSGGTLSRDGERVPGARRRWIRGSQGRHRAPD